MKTEEYLLEFFFFLKLFAKVFAVPHFTSFSSTPPRSSCTPELQTAQQAFYFFFLDTRIIDNN